MSKGSILNNLYSGRFDKSKFFSSLDAIGQVVSRRRGVDLRNLYRGDRASFSLAGFDILSRGPGTVSAKTLQGLDPSILSEYGRFLYSNTSREKSILYANDSKDVAENGHLYAFRSREIPISTSMLRFIDSTGPNVLRAFISTFPNGGSEIPPNQVDRILMQNERAIDGSRDVPFLSPTVEKLFTKQQWDKNNPLEGIVRLGASYVNMTNHKVISEGNFIIHTMTPITSMRHMLDGTALHHLVFNTQTNSFIFSVVGSGQHVFKTVDILNQPIAGALWSVMAESNRYFFERLTALHAERPELVGELLFNSLIRKEFESAMKQEASSLYQDRTILELADKASPIIIEARLFAGLDTASYPTPDPIQVDKATEIIDRVVPDEPFMSRSESREFLKESGVNLPDDHGGFPDDPVDGHGGTEPIEPPDSGGETGGGSDGGHEGGGPDHGRDPFDPSHDGHGGGERPIDPGHGSGTGGPHGE